MGGAFGLHKGRSPLAATAGVVVDRYVFVVFSWPVWLGLFAVVEPRIAASAATVADRLAEAVPQLGTDVLSRRLGAPSRIGGLPAWAAPDVDVDLTASTDCEDLAAFLADVVEFIEQDRALLADAVLDLGASATLGAAFAAAGRGRGLSAFLAR